MKNFQHEVLPENAGKFRQWIRERGGVALWRSISLSNPGASWFTPARTADGQPMGKPNWQSDDVPTFIVTSEDDVGVVTEREVKRFRVAVRGGRSNPFMIKLTEGSAKRLRRELEKVGDGASYTFDYHAQEAVILVIEETVSLSEWKE